MVEQKRIATLIQRAADRAERLGYAAATDKQVWYLAGLLVAKGLEADEIGCGAINSNATLTSREASAYIDDLSGAAAVRRIEELAVEKAIVAQTIDIAAQRAAADRDVAAAFPDEWAAADSLVGTDRREAKRLLRRRFEAGQA
jgi:hypothetical protein